MYIDDRFAMIKLNILRWFYNVLNILLLKNHSADHSWCWSFLVLNVLVLIIPRAERFLCWTFRAERSVLKISVLKIPDPSGE